MNAKNTRITSDLYWVALRYRFHTIELLKNAIEDGTIEGMLKACAESVYGGEFKLAIDAMRKNLSSQQTNMKKASYVPIEAKDDWTRYELLWNYTGKLAESVKPVIEGLPVSTKAKSRWQLTREEIESIPKNDFKALDSVYQNMQSAKSKYPEDVEAQIGMTEFMDRLAIVSKLRSAARAEVKAAENKVSDATLTKLSKGGKTTLTAAEVAELMKALTR